MIEMFPDLSQFRNDAFSYVYTTTTSAHIIPKFSCHSMPRDVMNVINDVKIRQELECVVVIRRFLVVEPEGLSTGCLPSFQCNSQLQNLTPVTGVLSDRFLMFPN